VSEGLCSVGLDVGTTSTQMIVSRLEIENRAGSFSVPELEIGSREILYKSPVYFTPLLDESHVDAAKLKKIIDAEYQKAGIRREQVDTGAVIITGETSRKENARAVLEALSDLAGDFVVATAGPDLESVLAAKGAGAVAYSEETGKTVLHMDIGGGTSNLALIRQGQIESTGCLNVGGRLLKLSKDGRVLYVSPVLDRLCKLKTGDTVSQEQVEAVAQVLVQALEMAAGLRERTQLLDAMTTPGTAMMPPAEEVVISFSGGVADCIDQEHPWLAFGDMGPVLGQCIRKSQLCRKAYRLGSETIRATVIGAGCHSAQLSGSTIFSKGVPFPLKNCPVVCISEQEQDLPREELARRIRKKLSQQDTESILALPGYSAPDYSRVKELAGAIAEGMGQQRVMVALEQDMAKALGQAIALGLPRDTPCLCIDKVRLRAGSFLDVGAPVGPALPVVVKTLVLQQ